MIQIIESLIRNHKEPKKQSDSGSGKNVWIRMTPAPGRWPSGRIEAAFSCHLLIFIRLFRFLLPAPDEHPFVRIALATPHAGWRNWNIEYKKHYPIWIYTRSKFQKYCKSSGIKVRLGSVRLFFFFSYSTFPIIPPGDQAASVPCKYHNHRISVVTRWPPEPGPVHSRWPRRHPLHLFISWTHMKRGPRWYLCRQ